MKVFLPLVFLFTCLSAFAQSPGCTYVAETGGINVYQKADTSSVSIDHLSFGTVVKVIETARVDTFKTGNKSLPGNWVRVMYSKDSKCLGMEDIKTESGYVFDALLSVHLRSLPAEALYHFHNLWLGPDEHKHIHYSEPAGDCFSKDTKKGSLYLADCYPYYSNNLSSAQIGSSEKTNEFDKSLGWRDTLKSYLKLDLVNYEEFKSKRIKNKYDIDTTPIVHYRQIGDGLRSFYLATRNGKDSVLFQDVDNYESPHHSYAGRIKSINKYVLDIAFEGRKHYLVDMQSGQKEEFTLGFPYISPDGRYVLEVFRTDHFANRATWVTISKLDKNFKTTRILTVEFKSWIAFSEPKDCFWISNRELIIKAMPVDNVNKPELQRPFEQYISLKIL